ncbi:MAG: fused MFS/spermidine synthase [Bacteroidales bacterium]|nr:fused MFS/spermidine synthase [Bacteroidales bacterium]
MSRFFSKYLSSFFPAERIQTPYNYLEVNKLNGHWVLDSSHVNYSFGTLHTVFQDALNLFVPDISTIHETLILGFGAGSVAHILQKERQYKGNITGVEIDPKVIDLGKKYFHLDNIGNLSLHITDAFRFTEENKIKFDLIIVDLFTDNVIPETFEKETFLTHVKDSLQPGGILLYNRMNYSPAERMKTKKFSKSFHSVFANCKISEEQTIQIKNKIFFAQK